MQESQKDNWKFGVVTFLDILGWKGIWERKRETEPLEKLNILIEHINTTISMLEKNLITRKPFIKEQKVISISDTIAIFSEIDKGTDAYEDYSFDEEIKEQIQEMDSTKSEFALSAHGIILSNCISKSIELHIPVRGVTSVGKYILDENKFLGPAIDEAAEWFDKCDWIGVNLTPTAFLSVDEDSFGKSESWSSWIQHTPPFKSGPQWKSLCVNWPLFWYINESKDRRTKLLKQVFKDIGPIGPDLVGKFTHTLEFFNKCISDKKSETNP